jgi:hypothetical protein
MSTRRAFLSTLGKVLGAGGVLLPLAGKGALALPSELGNAASLPVAPAPLPVSPEMLRLREIRQELHQIYLSHPHDYSSHKAREKAWRDVMRNQHTPTAQQIIGRKKTTWADCVEIAEIALHGMHRRGPYDRNDPLVALVWAVMSAGGIEEVFVPEIGDFRLEKGPRGLW